MKASSFLLSNQPLPVKVLPSLGPLTKSVDRVMARWPDAVKKPRDNDRERLAQEMRLRVRDWSWRDVKTSFITTTAVAVFDEERRARPDLSEVRDFYINEILASSQTSFLNAMLWVYLGSFDPSQSHTRVLAEALAERKNDLGDRSIQMMSSLHDIFKPNTVTGSLGHIMCELEDPYQGLKNLGFRSPHSPGFTQYAHRAFVAQIAPHLKKQTERERLFQWLEPEGGKALQAGAGIAVEALLNHWRTTTPSDDVRSEISEAILSAYGDPRTTSGGIWSGFDPDLKAVLLKWLTKQDMLFFCDMVSATQDNHMWPPRRDFWLNLYEDGLIEEAWVAFGASARRYASQNLARSGTTDINRRFGRQIDRGGSTSLLIMRIGSKIVVDGCHSYKTHIFNKDDQNAPKLYGDMYYCDAIMRRSRNSKPHNSIPVWKDWVMRHV